MIRLYYLLLFLVLISVARSQDVRLVSVGFYNLENLFDTKDDPHFHDEEYTPKGKRKWHDKIVAQKLKNLSTVIASVGEKEGLNGLDLVGVAEVENAAVLKRLIKMEALKNHQYGFVHFESEDYRGIDVALLYKQQNFIPITSKRYRLSLKSDKQFPIKTRDQLVVSGLLLGEEVVLLVNHWPSRRGGRKKSDPLRIAAARQQQLIMDSLTREKPTAKIIVMGDFNDNPTDKSVKSLSLKNRYLKDYRPLFNPMETLQEKGIGSLAYRDQWFLFDQILLSTHWLQDPNFFFLKAAVYNPPWLIAKEGRYKGYPFRTKSRGSILEGYSDHFPVFAIFALRH